MNKQKLLLNSIKELSSLYRSRIFQKAYLNRIKSNCKALKLDIQKNGIQL